VLCLCFNCMLSIGLSDTWQQGFTTYSVPKFLPKMAKNCLPKKQTLNFTFQTEFSIQTFKLIVEAFETSIFSIFFSNWCFVDREGAFWSFVFSAFKLTFQMNVKIFHYLGLSRSVCLPISQNRRKPTLNNIKNLRNGYKFKRVCAGFSLSNIQYKMCTFNEN